MAARPTTAKPVRTIWQWSLNLSTSWSSESLDLSLLHISSLFTHEMISLVDPDGKDHIAKIGMLSSRKSCFCLMGPSSAACLPCHAPTNICIIIYIHEQLIARLQDNNRVVKLRNLRILVMSRPANANPHRPDSLPIPQMPRRF
jgi:hypothetical protein